MHLGLPWFLLVFKGFTVAGREMDVPKNCILLQLTLVVMQIVWRYLDLYRAIKGHWLHKIATSWSVLLHSPLPHLIHILYWLQSHAAPFKTSKYQLFKIWGEKVLPVFSFFCFILFYCCWHFWGQCSLWMDLGYKIGHQTNQRYPPLLYN